MHIENMRMWTSENEENVCWKRVCMEQENKKQMIAGNLHVGRISRNRWTGSKSSRIKRTDTRLTSLQNIILSRHISYQWIMMFYSYWQFALKFAWKNLRDTGSASIGISWIYSDNLLMYKACGLYFFKSNKFFLTKKLTKNFFLYFFPCFNFFSVILTLQCTAYNVRVCYWNNLLRKYTFLPEQSNLWVRNIRHLQDIG